MTGILMLESLTRGNTLKQGDKTPLTYRLLDADGDNLSIAGKTATVRLMHPNYLTIGYEKSGLLVSQDDTVTFTIDNVIPSRKYNVEIIVDNKFVFPSRSAESKFTIDRSSLGTESNIIEIVGVDAVVRKAVDLINDDPNLIIDEDKLVSDIISNTGLGSIEAYYQQFSDVITELSKDKDYHSLPEISAARGGHETLGARLDETTAQLAQTAKKADVDAVDERVDNLVIPLSPENANIEVTDAHFSQVKNKTFPSLSKRIEDVEKSTFIPATNIVRNSEFQTNAQYWSGSGSALRVNSGALIITGNGAARYAQGRHVTDIDVVTGDSYYVSSEVEVMSGEPTSVRFDFRGAVGTVHTVGQYTNPSVGVINRVSNVLIPDSSHSGKINILLTSFYTSALEATDSVTSIKRPIIINLTETYGKGYEPTALEMDEILRGLFADSWFSNTANILDIGNLLKEQKLIKKAVSEIEMPEIPNDIGAYTGVQKTRGQLITKTNPNTILGGSSYTSEQRPMWTITYDDESDTIYDYAFPVHKAEDVPGVFYVVPDKVGTGLQYDWGKADTWDRILEMEHSEIGRIEIQHHTTKHLVVPNLTNDELRENIEYGNELFIEQGIYPRHFAYPYGSNNARVRNVLQEYFETCTSTQLGINLFSLHPMKIKRRSSDSYGMESFKAAIDSAVSNNGWLITYQHAIHPSKIAGKDSRACMSPSEMTELIQYAKSKGVDIVSLDDGLKTFAPWQYYFKESQEPVHSIRRNGVEIKPKKTLLVEDDFNRTDNATTLGTAATGQQWSVSGGTWGIDNNTAYQATTGGGNALVSTESDCIIHCTLADTETSEARLIFRYKDADNYWMLRPRGVGYGYELVKREAGSRTTPAYKRDVVAKNGDKIKVILDDADIIVFVNDVEICNTVNSHNKEYGKHGLTAAFSDTARWDDFMITSI